MSAGALSNLRVIDLTHYIAGPYCTKLMAGFGAEVIKIERPETGDKMRSLGPFYKGERGCERSIPFLWLNTGKKSITLDIRSTKGRTILKDLIKTADVVVENFSPRVLAELELDYDSIAKVNPDVVMTSISNYGQTGPYRDYKAEEIEAYAMSGLMYLTGHPDRPPLNSGPALTQYTAGMNAYTATLIALFHRGITGKGQHVDVSIQETSLTNVEWSLAECLQLEKDKKRNDDHHMMVPWEGYECKDGYAAVVCGPVRHWCNAANIFDNDEHFNKKYRHCLARMWYRDEYEEILKPSIKKHTKKELFHLGQEQKLAFGFQADLEEAVQSPQHKSREFFVPIEHPEVGSHGYCGAPFKMSETPWKDCRAPLLGEDNEAVYQEVLGFSKQEVQDLAKEGVV